MASKSKPFFLSRFNSIFDDDDFQISLTQTATAPKAKKPRRSKSVSSGKEIIPPNCFSHVHSILEQTQGFKFTPVEDCSLDSIPASFDCGSVNGGDVACSSVCVDEETEKENAQKETLKSKGGYSCNSIESKLIKPRADCGFGSVNGESANEDFGELDVLLRLCNRPEEGGKSVGVSGVEEGFVIVEDENGGLVQCPLCGADISDLSNEERELHSNECLDKEEIQAQDAPVPDDGQRGAQVLEWLRRLGLEKYEDVFAREEIDWDTLQWLTEEDLLSIGITALGPRKKIERSLAQLRGGTTGGGIDEQPRKRSSNEVVTHNVGSEEAVDDTSKMLQIS